MPSEEWIAIYPMATKWLDAEIHNPRMNMESSCTVNCKLHTKYQTTDRRVNLAVLSALLIAVPVQHERITVWLMSNLVGDNSGISTWSEHYTKMFYKVKTHNGTNTHDLSHMTAQSKQL